MVSQGHALNRGVLTEAIIAAHVERAGVTGNHLYGKADLPALHAGEGIPRRSPASTTHITTVVKDPARASTR